MFEWFRGLAVLLLVVACSATPEQDLINWIVSLGGSVKAEIRTNRNGVRGLFATEDIALDSPITVIPAEAVIHVGGNDFETPLLLLLRELHADGLSRYQPYLNTLPKRHEVLNSCNFPRAYLNMLQSSFWEDLVLVWDTGLQGVLDGTVFANHALTLPEAVGSKWRNITREDLQYACALSTTRYVLVAPRTAALLVPIFDLMNHDRKCQNHFNNVIREGLRGLEFVAGEDIKEGTELCSYYGDLRDDYALMHYGFLPRLEHPPRLCLMDHPANTANTYEELQALHAATSADTDDFEGTATERQAELVRLKGILERLEELDQQPAPDRTVAGADFAYDLLLQLQQRRRAALSYWIADLATSLTSVSDDAKDEF